MASPTDNQQEPPLRLNLVEGTIVLFVLLSAFLGLTFFITIRFGSGDLGPWLCCLGPAPVLFTCFSARLCRCCGWKHLLLALGPILGVALVVIIGVLRLSLDNPELYMALGVVLAMVVAPGLLGVGLAAWATARALTTKRQAIVVLLLICLYVTMLGSRWLGWQIVTWYTGSHADVAGTPYLRANAKDLEHTTVVPTLDASIPVDTNVVWCATFQIAWNELCALAGEDLRMEREDPVVALLNRKPVTRKNLDESTYYAVAGLVRDGVVTAVTEGLKRQFRGAAAPELTASLANLPPDAAVAYAYLFVNLPFEWALERLKYPIKFGEVEVKAFGIGQYLASQEKELRAASQVQIHVFDAQRGVIMELRTRLPNHRLILAKVPPLATLGATVQSVMGQVRQSQPQALPEHACLAIPIIDFDLTRDYAEVTGRRLRVRKPPLTTGPIIQARQQIRLKLDERGAVLRSEAAIALFGMGDNLIFDQPFLILLQLAGSDQPYFAAWIAHPELLVKF